MDEKPQKKRSLFVTLNRYNIGIWLIMVVLCVSAIVYSFHEVRSEAVRAEQSIVDVGKNQLSASLDSAAKVLNEGVRDYLSVFDFYSPSGAEREYRETSRLAAFMETKMEVNPCVDCIFFIDDGVVSLKRFQLRVLYDEKFALTDYLAGSAETISSVESNSWILVNIAGRNYLLRYYRLSFRGLGVLIDPDTLLQSASALAGDADERYCLINGDGLVISGPGTGETLPPDEGADLSSRQLRVTEAIAGTPLRVCAVKTFKGFLYDTGWAPFLFVSLGVIAVVLILRYSIFLRKRCIGSIASLNEATKIVSSGNLDYEIPDQSGTEELSELTTSFNNMTRQIKTQKIEMYEREIQLQRMELKTLRLQLRPHFYLSSINTILNLSRQNRNEEIQDFIMALSQYLRYMFNESNAPATVAEEVAHAEDYIKLQQIRNPNSIFFMSETDTEVRKVPMPRLLVQTFTENIFKHAYDGENMLSIFIRAKYVDEGGGAFCRITVEDNGRGFSQEDLANGFPSHGTGFATIRKTLELTYKRDDLLKIYNRDEGGACVSLDIPIENGKGA